MNDLDKMARELLAEESRKLGLDEAAYHIGCGGDLDMNDQSAINAIRAALLAAPPGYVLVPVELIDAFPEINPSNYDHDDACRLNAWGCELVTATTPDATTP